MLMSIGQELMQLQSESGSPYLTERQGFSQIVVHIHAQLGNDLGVCLRLKCHLLLDLHAVIALVTSQLRKACVAVACKTSSQQMQIRLTKKSLRGL